MAALYASDVVCLLADDGGVLCADGVQLVPHLQPLHPDVRAHASSESGRREPSIYELNAAYEAVRKIL